MEIYTLVSLCIGIFGATYAALNAIRIHFELSINDYCKNSIEKLGAVQKIKGDTRKGTKNCVKHHNSTLRWKRAWLISHLVPAVVFFASMAFIAIWVLWGWDEIISKHDDPEKLKTLYTTFPWSYFRKGFFWMGVIDLCAVITAFFAWFLCRYYSGRVGELHESFLEEDGLQDPNSQAPANGAP